MSEDAGAQAPVADTGPTNSGSAVKGTAVTGTAVFDLDGLQDLLDALRRRGYTVVGPTVRDGAVTHAEVTSVDDLPRGVGDRQGPASYRLRERGDGTIFGFAAAAQSWKPLLFPARRLLWRVRDGVPQAPDSAVPRYAFLGVRSCDLHAIEVQDRVFLDRMLESGGGLDPDYAARRRSSFVVAVNCAEPGGTCFCVSMGTGPRARRGYDLALTELLDDGGHRFLAEVGQRRRGAAARRAADRARHGGRRRRGGRRLHPRGRADGPHPRHRRPSRSCSTPTPSTRAGTTSPAAACPAPTARWSARPASAPPSRTTADLTGDEAVRGAVWDSCFTVGYSHVHGGSVRARPGRATGSGRPTSWPPGTTSSAPRVRRVRALHHLVPGRHRPHRGGRRDPGEPVAGPAGDRAGPGRPDGEPIVQGVGQLLAERRSSPGWTPTWSTCSPGARRTCTSGRTPTCSVPARRPTGFYVVRRGRVALEIHGRAGGPRWSTPWTTATSSAGRGWSPRTAGSLDARAVEPTSAVALDAACLRAQVRRRPAAGLRAACSGSPASCTAGCRAPGCACSTSTGPRCARSLTRGSRGRGRRRRRPAAAVPCAQPPGGDRGHRDGRAGGDRRHGAALPARPVHDASASPASARCRSRSAGTRLAHRSLQHTVRAVGAAPPRWCGARAGQTVLGVRGPFGTSWPVPQARGGDLRARRRRHRAGAAAAGASLAVLADRDRYGRVTLLSAPARPPSSALRRRAGRWAGATATSTSRSPSTPPPPAGAGGSAWSPRCCRRAASSPTHRSRWSAGPR